MTYLELVNKVLLRLREDEVLNIADTDYAKMVGELVNDAIEIVSSAWDWTALRQSYTFNTVSGSDSYSLSGFGINSEVKNVYDTTVKREIPYASSEYLTKKKITAPNSGNPLFWTIKGMDSNGDAKIVFYPTPNVTNGIQVEAIVRNSRLESDNDSTALPASVIAQYAFGFALRERGETGGQNAQEQISIAVGMLSNAIALDAGLHQDELVFKAV